MKPGCSPAQRVRLGDVPLLVALDPGSGRLLKYQEITPPGGVGDASGAGGHATHDGHHHHRRGGGRSWKLDAALWSERDCVEARHVMMCYDNVYASALAANNTVAHM
jgi:hypothetical protein